MPYQVGKKGSYGCSGFPALKDDGTVMGCHSTAAQAAAQIYAINLSEGNIGKAMVTEGDFVIASSDDEIYVGRVEHVMTDGYFGLEGSEYYMEATMEEPAVLIRKLEFEDEGQYWEETKYLIGFKASEVTKIEPLPLEVEAEVVDMNGEMMIMTEEKSQSLFSPENFGKDYTRSQKLDDFFKRDRTMETRRRLAQSGQAMPDGSYPIVTVEDLRNAIQAFGRSDDPRATKEHIKRRARALGRTDLLPENWR